MFLLLISLVPRKAAAYGDRAPIDIQNLRIAPGDARLVSVDLARVGERGSWVPQAVLHYADRPLVLLCQGSCLPRAYLPLVAHRLTLDASVAVSFLDRIQLALVLPATLYQYTDPGIQDVQAGNMTRGAEPTAPIPQVAGLGDARLHVKVAFLPRAWRVGLGLDGALSLPTGDGNSYLGTRLPAFTARLLGHVEYKRLTVALNFGGHFAQQEQIVGLQSGIALTYGLGVQVKLLGDGADEVPLYLLAEAYGWGFTRFDGASDFPTEFLVAIRSEPRRLGWFAGAGSTLYAGAGSPNVRVLMGISYSSRRSAPRR